LEKEVFHMNTLIILGAGQFGRKAAYLFKRETIQILAFGDNNSALWGKRIAGFPVMPVAQALRLGAELALIGVTDPERTRALKEQALVEGFQGRFLLLEELYRFFDVRSATLEAMSRRILESGVEGSIAELGVYKGDTAWKLNCLFPKRQLYLFDTFRGFDPRDIAEEQNGNFSRAREGDFSDTSEKSVLSRLPFPQMARFKKGFFPETAAGLEEETFALVSLDADLYAPIFAGLEFFYPRLSQGGMILLHDYNNSRFQGAHEAVGAYEKAHGLLPLVPLCDLHGSAVIVKA
jgi:O-methyltransferase